ncbi:TylF/MycF/NovP-related O-methyltransferase [Thermodesulfobacteriota bacterium]
MELSVVIRNSIKQLFKHILKLPFSMMGIEVAFLGKYNAKLKTDKVIIDKLFLQRYFKPDSRILLYYEGLKKANSVSADNFAKQCRFFSLQQLVEFVLSKDLRGDFVECGCWKGHSAYVISKILFDNNASKKLQFHIFDSFQGLSDKGLEDKNERWEQNDEDIKHEKQQLSAAEDEAKNTLADFEFVRLYKGWIPNRFWEIKNKHFSFVHIVVDLYQPTMDSLIFFYPRLLPGGVVVISDYGYTQFPGVKKAVDEFLNKTQFNMFYAIPIGGCFIIK